MALEIRCDHCGKLVEREDACAMVMVRGAFRSEGKGQKEQFELCPLCCEGLAACCLAGEKLMERIDGL